MPKQSISASNCTFPVSISPATDTPDAGAHTTKPLDKRAVDMAVTSATADADRRQPESRPATSSQWHEQSQQSSHRTNGQRQQNCDNLRIDGENVASMPNGTACAGRNANGDRQPARTTEAVAFNDDLGDDPYAELQSYLEKVKVSTVLFAYLSGRRFRSVFHSSVCGTFLILCVTR